jgi:hypothetical protein
MPGRGTARPGVGSAEARAEQRPADVLWRSVAVYVVFTAWVAALLGVAGAVWVLHDLGDRHRALSASERLHGDWRYRVVPDRPVLDDALRLIPADASYRVVVDPSWSSRFRSPWTRSLERDLMTFVLFPRRLTTSTDAEWVLCMGCDASTAGAHGVVVSRGRDMQLIRARR